MEHLNWDNVVVVTCAIIGGMIRFFTTEFMSISFIESLIKVGITAFVSGVMGLMGKYAITWAREKWKSKRTKNQNSKS